MSYNISFTNLTNFEADLIGTMISDYRSKICMQQVKAIVNHEDAQRIEYLDQQYKMCEDIIDKLVCLDVSK